MNISDAALITAAHPLTKPTNARGRKYEATYSDGTSVLFAVGHAEAARTYAREYGVRFLGGARVLTVVWAR
jgi:hypothetical protein